MIAGTSCILIGLAVLLGFLAWWGDRLEDEGFTPDGIYKDKSE